MKKLKPEILQAGEPPRTMEARLDSRADRDALGIASLAVACLALLVSAAALCCGVIAVLRSTL